MEFAELHIRGFGVTKSDAEVKILGWDDEHDEILWHR